jgi:hypothetical protein
VNYKIVSLLSLHTPKYCIILEKTSVLFTDAVLNYLNRFGYFPAQVEGERGGSLVAAANGVPAALKNLQKMAGKIDTGARCNSTHQNA